MLSRRDPFREMMSLQRSLDRLMENALGDQGEYAQSWSLALDVVEDEGAFIVKASLPGVKPEDIDVTYNNGTLTIRGEVKDEREEEKGQYHLRERRYGQFSRSVTLPTTIQGDSISATYENGVLMLNLPKSEEVKPRRIQVNRSANGQQTIEGKVK